MGRASALRLARRDGASIGAFVALACRACTSPSGPAPKRGRGAARYPKRGAGLPAALGAPKRGANRGLRQPRGLPPRLRFHPRAEQPANEGRSSVLEPDVNYDRIVFYKMLLSAPYFGAWTRTLPSAALRVDCLGPPNAEGKRTRAYICNLRGRLRQLMASMHPKCQLAALIFHSWRWYFRCCGLLCDGQAVQMGWDKPESIRPSRAAAKAFFCAADYHGLVAGLLVFSLKPRLVSPQGWCHPGVSRWLAVAFCNAWWVGPLRLSRLEAVGLFYLEFVFAVQRLASFMCLVALVVSSDWCPAYRWPLLGCFFISQASALLGLVTLPAVMGWGSPVSPHGRHVPSLCDIARLTWDVLSSIGLGRVPPQRLPCACVGGCCCSGFRTGAYIASLA